MTQPREDNSLDPLDPSLGRSVASGKLMRVDTDGSPTEALETTSPPEVKLLEEGEIVKIVRGQALGLFVDDTARLSFILGTHTLAQVNGKERVVPTLSKNGSPRERQEHQALLQNVTRERIRVSITGSTVSGEVKVGQANVYMDELEPLPGVEQLPKRRETKTAKKPPKKNPKPKK